MLALIPFLVLVAFVVGFVVAAWSPRIGAARDRLGLVMDGVLAAGLLLAGRMIVDWSTVSVIAWYALVALLAAGVVGAVLRWEKLPVLKDPAKRTRRTWGAGVTAAITLGLVAVTNL
jgi:hypothetical protein